MKVISIFYQFIFSDLSDKISDFFPVIEDANEKSKAALEILKKINREKEETKVKELGEIPKIKDELSDTCKFLNIELSIYLFVGHPTRLRKLK